MTSRLSSALTQLNTQSIRDINSTTAQQHKRHADSGKTIGPSAKRTWLIPAASIHYQPSLCVSPQTFLHLRTVLLMNALVPALTHEKIDLRSAPHTTSPRLPHLDTLLPMYVRALAPFSHNGHVHFAPVIFVCGKGPSPLAVLSAVVCVVCERE